MGVIQNSLCEQCHLIGFAPEYLFPGTLVLNRKIGPLRKLPGYSHTKTTSKVGCTSIAGRFRQWSGRCNSHVVVLGLSLKASSGNRKCGSRTAFANAERQLHSQNLIWLYLDLGVSGKKGDKQTTSKTVRVTDWPRMTRLVMGRTTVVTASLRRSFQHLGRLWFINSSRLAPRRNPWPRYYGNLCVWLTADRRNTASYGNLCVWLIADKRNTGHHTEIWVSDWLPTGETQDLIQKCMYLTDCRRPVSADVQFQRTFWWKRRGKKANWLNRASRH